MIGFPGGDWDLPGAVPQGTLNRAGRKRQLSFASSDQLMKYRGGMYDTVVSPLTLVLSTFLAPSTMSC